VSKLTQRRTHHVGTVAVVRQAIIKEGKAKLGEIASKAFGKTIKFD